MSTSAVPAGKTWLRQSFLAANGRSFTVSVGVINGARPGPTFSNVAGQHGMEHIGPLVLRDFFDEVDPQTLAGTLYVCPCANPLALAYDYEVFPERETNLPEPFTQTLTSSMFGFKERDDLGNYNMNRCWPDDINDPNAGNPGEGVATRVTRWLWKTMIEPAHVVVDHHSVLRARKPYIFCEEEVIPWTPLLGLEAVWCTGPLKPAPLEYPYRRLSMQAIRHGKIGICIEYSVQHAIKEEDRGIGRFALFNMMKALGMIEGKPEILRPVWLIPGPYWEHLEELKSAHAGHVHFCAEDYQWLKQGQLIAQVRDLQTNDILDTIAPPYDCLMLHRTPRPLSRPNDWLCRVSRDARLLAEPNVPYPVPPLRCSK